MNIKSFISLHISTYQIQGNYLEIIEDCSHSRNCFQRSHFEEHNHKVFGFAIEFGLGPVLVEIGLRSHDQQPSLTRQDFLLEPQHCSFGKQPRK